MQRDDLPPCAFGSLGQDALRPLFLSWFFNSMASSLDFACGQLSGFVATTALTRKYSVSAISTHAKDKDVSKAPAMKTERTFQIAQDWHTSNVLLSPHIRKPR